MSTGAVILLVVVVLLVLGAGAWFLMQRSRRSRLRQRFGPEYDRRVQEADDRRVVERELSEREKRHARFNLRPLSDDERARYADQWTVLQEQFVDRPGEAVVAAEQLVHTVMRDRGYPTENFEQQASDLSVEHASAVDSYRSGHDIRARHEQAGVSTEELRQALMHYRAIFASLAGIDERSEDRAGTDPAVDRAYQAGRADAGGQVDSRTDGRADGRADGMPRTDMPENADHRHAGDHAVDHSVDEPRRTS